MKEWKVRSALILCMGLFVGCAGTADMSHLPPEEQVSLRAQAWADALMAGEINEAYSFTSPVYRKTSTVGRYFSRVAGVGNWVSMNVDSVSCRDEVCDVRFLLKYKQTRMKTVNTRPMNYRWVNSDGQWWLYISSR